ncbi:MAG: glycosyl transferase family 36 [Dokdonella sp.]
MPANALGRVTHARQHCLLSNSRYSVMLSDSGSGFSRWCDLAVTRWREDVASDPWGSYLLLRDEVSGNVWSPTRQPYGTELPDDAVSFHPGRAAFSRRNDDLHSLLEVAVDPESDIELRRLTLTNHGDRTRTLSITSYTEIVIGPAASDNAHPAFSKMFVQTDRDAASGLLLATRRRRSNSEPEVWAAQTLQVLGEPLDSTLEYETDRARFLGRGRNLRRAQAMQPHCALSNSSGCVLDPIFSLRRSLSLAPGATATLLLWMKLADSRAEALTLSMQRDNANAPQQLFSAAVAHAENELEQLDIDAARGARIAHWLDAVLASDPAQRPASSVLGQGRGGPPVLWGAGISADRPILLQCLQSPADLACTRDLLLAQNLWRGKQLAVDVVLLNTATGGEGDRLQKMLEPLTTAQDSRLKADAIAVKCELFALLDAAINVAVRNGLVTAARVVLGLPLRKNEDDAPVAADALTETAIPSPIKASVPAGALPSFTSVLEFANGLGGFSDDGREYEIHLTDERCTPAPWVNVIANPHFGCLISAEGGGYTWSMNSQQNAITPWPNDPVSDSPHEVIYLRDAESGQLWSATALPIRISGAKYHVTHSKGCSRFVTDAHGIDLDLTLCVPPQDSIKLSRLRLCNRSANTRRLSVTAFVEWALGANGTTAAPYVITARDGQTGALFARNPWRADFGDRIAFLDLCGQQHSMSGDRCEFLGPFGTVEQPAALQDCSPLRGRFGAGVDPCGALQARIELPPHTQIEIVMLLGDAAGEMQAQALIQKYRTIAFEQVLIDIRTQWRRVLDTIRVRTPNRAMDILLNDWLLYQALGCRVWARTAYYQASGAYGFRDQLQDIMALCVSRPDIAREQLLRAAGRQFAQGDVQHWWLPPGGAGIRTRISDDRAWLVYVASHYVDVSGDAAVLDEALPFLVGQAIPDHARDTFFVPTESAQKASVYEHCALAIDASLTVGAHGLPLMGTGDWNDGMNAVGEQGRGESAWLGWFLLASIEAFTPHAERRGDRERAKRWTAYAANLRDALERAWDGQWYRRGYYDDGTPLGSRESTECQIDAIAQSWSVMAGAVSPQHTAEAMASIDRMLVDHKNHIALLFTPPFDGGTANPGYIKGYPPGVRENGGQYTHGAIWSIFAWARLGDGERGGALFDILNPILHADSAEAIDRYKVEPYVSCADVYSVAPHVGRGGWTWYSGSAAWLYRAGLEALLGFQLHGDRLRIDPCIPSHWDGFQLIYKRRGQTDVSTEYEICVENPRHACRGVSSLALDGAALAPADAIVLVDDGNTHTLRIVLG